MTTTARAAPEPKPVSPGAPRCVGILGRGLAGLSLAFRLRDVPGMRVHVWGRTEGPRVASLAAQGLSNSKGLWIADQPLLRLKLTGHQRLAAWLRDVEKAAGRVIPKVEQVWEPYATPVDFQRIVDRVYHGRPWGAHRARNERWGDVRRATWPFAAESFLGAMRYPSDLWFDVASLLDALTEATRRRGHAFHPDEAESVQALDDGRFRVSAPDGPWDVDELVIAAGAGSPSLLAQLGVAGTYFAEAPGATASMARAAAVADDGAAFLFGDKSLIVTPERFRWGAVSPSDGDVADPAAWAESAARAALAELWRKLAGSPCPADAALEVIWGTRLRTRRRMPVATAVPVGPRGKAVHVTTAFHKNGLQLAPLAAERIACLLTGCAPAEELEPMAALRPW